MNIIISGYGKMGREVESTALKQGHRILSVFDRPDDWHQLEELKSDSPVVIDFSQPDTARDNIFHCFRHKVPVVVGTTGWKDQQAEIIETCRREGHTLLIASNFSIGVNLFFAVNEYLAGLMEKQEDYDVRLEETHHIHKLDKPSGTAITLAEQVIGRISRKKGWVLDEEQDMDKLSVRSVREGEVFGDHEVAYESPVDIISIRHSAKNRKGFALGAVLAAEWIRDKKGYFEMRDFLGI